MNRIVRSLKTRGLRGTWRLVLARACEWGLRLKTRGLRHTWRLALARAWEMSCEWRLGLRSSEFALKERVDYDNSCYRPYGPTPDGDFRALMKSLGRWEINAVFVDFGSGMGRILILAGMHAFRKVIGVEVSSQLCQAAERTIERVRAKLKCRSIEIVTCDAAAYAVPTEATVLYFAQSFSGHILDSVLENIKKSLMQKPRRILLLSYNYNSDLSFEKQIQKAAWLKPPKVIVLGYRATGWIYENTAWGN